MVPLLFVVIQGLESVTHFELGPNDSSPTLDTGGGEGGRGEGRGGEGEGRGGEGEGRGGEGEGRGGEGEGRGGEGEGRGGEGDKSQHMTQEMVIP